MGSVVISNMDGYVDHISLRHDARSTRTHAAHARTAVLASGTCCEWLIDFSVEASGRCAAVWE